MKAVRVLVLTGYGLNCDVETAYAFDLAGACSERVHINSLIDGDARVDGFHILAFVGGFSWGDDHGAGVVQAVRLRYNLGSQFQKFIKDGMLIIGICNGFQTLVNLGLLPGLNGNYTKRSVALTFNDCGNFRDDWVRLKINSASPCIFTKGLDELELPIRHGEGKFYTDAETLQSLDQGNQIVLQYAASDGELAKGVFPENPNGSLADIAGICDPTGRIFGLMPHPEAYNHWTNHPDWTRMKEERKRKRESRKTESTDPGPTDGIRILQNAVKYVRGNL
jgi:phosphoribosylformylglycinamidine synthase